MVLLVRQSVSQSILLLPLFLCPFFHISPPLTRANFLSVSVFLSCNWSLLLTCLFVRPTPLVPAESEDATFHSVSHSLLYMQVSESFCESFCASMWLSLSLTVQVSFSFYMSREGSEHRRHSLTVTSTDRSSPSIESEKTRELASWDATHNVKHRVTLLAAGVISRMKCSYFTMLLYNSCKFFHSLWFTWSKKYSFSLVFSHSSSFPFNNWNFLSSTTRSFYLFSPH